MSWSRDGADIWPGAVPSSLPQPTFPQFLATGRKRTTPCPSQAFRRTPTWGERKTGGNRAVESGYSFLPLKRARIKSLSPPPPPSVSPVPNSERERERERERVDSRLWVKREGRRRGSAQILIQFMWDFRGTHQSGSHVGGQGDPDPHLREHIKAV